MRRGVASDTPLELFLKKLGLQPVQVVAEAKRVARQLGLRVAISRTHFGRIRLGKQRATEEKILLIVATLRSMTGLAVRATDLFMLEPALGERAHGPCRPVPWRDAARFDILASSQVRLVGTFRGK